MRQLALLMTFFLFAGCAAATEPNPTTQPAAAEGSIERTLDALDERGRNLTGFTAQVTLSESSAATGDTTTRSGRVWYQSSEPDGGRIRVSFDTVTRDDGKTIKDRLDYLLSGGKLVDRNYRTKNQTTRQVLRPGERINLLKLGEGPFPLPIGQSRQRVLEMFDVAMVEPAAADPAGSTHLRLTPRPGTRFERQFKTLDVWVDNASSMPVRIATLDRNETTDRTTDLRDVQLNPTLADRNFALERVDLSGWNVVDEPYND